MSELSVVARKEGGIESCATACMTWFEGTDDKGDPEPLLVPHARPCPASIRFAGPHTY
jgi:hypothetical protein